MSTATVKPLMTCVLNPTLRSSGVPSMLALQRRHSSAFDPYWYLHYQTVNRNQQESFEKAWAKNRGDFKSKLSSNEFNGLEQKIGKIHTYQELEAKMTGLFGMSRHTWVRKTRTWKYSNQMVLQYIKDGHHPSTLIFGENEVFDKFRKNYLFDPEKLLVAFSYADLRYMCAVHCIDYCGGPPMLAVFGVRNKYHFNLPDPKTSDAKVQTLQHDRMLPYHLVILTVLNAIKENKPIDARYFQEMLDSKEHNALKDDPWLPFAKRATTMDEGEFYDQLIRAFVHFQTDPGVCAIQTRFDSDLALDAQYDEKRVWGLTNYR